MFERTSRGVSGTYYVGDIVLPPAAIVEKFGKPIIFSEGKVQGEYVFTDGVNLFTLYDYKSGISDFWSHSLPVPIHVGGCMDLFGDFIDWLLKEVNGE